MPYPALMVRRSLPQSGRTGAVIERSITKTGRERIVPLVELVRAVIAGWVSGRGSGDLIFPAPRGGLPACSELAASGRWEQTGPGRRPMI